MERVIEIFGPFGGLLLQLIQRVEKGDTEESKELPGNVRRSLVDVRDQLSMTHRCHYRMPQSAENQLKENISFVVYVINLTICFKFESSYLRRPAIHREVSQWQRILRNSNMKRNFIVVFNKVDLFEKSFHEGKELLGVDRLESIDETKQSIYSLFQQQANSFPQVGKIWCCESFTTEEAIKMNMLDLIHLFN